MRRGHREPVAQFTVRDRSGFIARVDFAYPDLRIAIELDGRAYHGDPTFEHDREKRLRLTTAGWCVVEITWKMLTNDPDLVFRRLAEIVAERTSSAL
jgi:very-short-patch-repair endonuclease